MAGHSQFKNIMHRKGRQDAVRSKMFSKLAREITVAAKLGMPDPAMNPRLRLAIQNAKAQSMPKDNIQRAINKAVGRRRRELRRGALRGLRSGRRRRHRRGADRQPQPHRLERPRRLHQGRRRARRNRLGIVPVGPRRRDLLPAEAGDADKVMEAAIEAGADDVAVRRGRPHHPVRLRECRRGVQGARSLARRSRDRSRSSGSRRPTCRSTRSARSR